MAPKTLRSGLIALATGVLLATSGCASSGGGNKAAPNVAPIENGPVQLSVFWWGGDARAQLTHQVLALYTQKHPNVTFKETWQANSGYIDKLNTELAGDAAPDIFQLDDNMLGGVAARNQTIDLDNYIGRWQAGCPAAGREHARHGLRQDPAHEPRRRTATDRLVVGEAHQLGDRREQEDQLQGVRDDGPVGRLQGFLGLAAPAR
jgi:hypothetical protein